MVLTSPLQAATMPMGQATPDELVTIDALRVTVPSRVGRSEAVRGVSFGVRRGEALGVVGESGSGKTLTCRALLGMLPPGCQVSSGSIHFDGHELSRYGERQWRSAYGTRIGAVFQDPGSYLNPAVPVGRQISEVLRVKGGLSRSQARDRAIELLGRMGLHQPAHVYRQIPSELSGGMVQRALLAIAVSCEPELLVADEATSALDVTTQAEVVDLIRELKRDLGLAVVFVSHDLALVQELCDRVVVFYSGEVVEAGEMAEVTARPRHPYTKALLEVSSLAHEGAWLPVIPGHPPAPTDEIVGCRFAERCAMAIDACRAGPVPDRDIALGHLARCVRAEDL